MRRVVLVVAFSAMAPAAGAQSLFERLNLDRLRLTALGLAAGPVRPSRVERTQAYSVFADYGPVARSWRVVFSATYWGSHFNDDVVQELEDRLRSRVIDPSGDDTLDIGRIDVSDIALEVDLRFTPRPNAAVRPYAGAGLGAHMINAESPFIADTFIESALDNISAGFAGFAGVDTEPLGRFSVGLQARMNMLSNVRFWSARASLTYFFAAQRPSSSP
ncbi:MAG: hypothetical protein ACT4PJ_07730 [Gemmatimonadaceae bacterium]